MLIDPKVLSRLVRMRLRARRPMEGTLSGLHQSPHRGQSVEFAEHKEYAPGDEIRHIDWRVYARADRYYVKQFEHETNLRACLALDASGSMGYGSNGQTKLDYARSLAAGIAHLLAGQQDAVGVAIYRHDVEAFVPPRAEVRALKSVLAALEEAKPSGHTRLAAAIDHLTERLHRRSLVVFFSDLFDVKPEELARLRQLRHHRHDVVVFQVLDPAEIEFPFEDPTLFLSLEDARTAEALPDAIREGYLAEIGAFLDASRRALAESDVHHVLVRTDEPVDRVLLRFLAGR